MTYTSASFATTWWQHITALPTRYHLFCAEYQLRAVTPDTLSLAHRQERQAHLDRLRSYRKMRRFPGNNRTTTTFTPCFVDNAGNACAVAYLMHASGNHKAVQQITNTMNYARLGHMHHDLLDTWDADSGLTKAELARIQPGYPPTIEALREQSSNILTAVMLIGALGILSIITNTVYLVESHLQRYTIIAGIAFGIALLYTSNRALQLSQDIAFFNQTQAIALSGNALSIYSIIAFVIGIFAIVTAVVRYWIHRRQNT